MLYDRVNSIDTAKGLIIILIVFFNFFFINHLPLWPSDTDFLQPHNIAGGLIYPAFIFLYCITIPFSITKKLNDGASAYEISRSIFARALVLITIGVLLANIPRVSHEETGMSRFIWGSALIAALFLVWNRYPEKENNFFTTSGLRLLGLTALVVLVFKFRSGSFENNGSLIPGWWELPGLTGWAWLTAAFSWLLLRNSAAGTAILIALFLSLNVFDYYGYTGFLDPVEPYFGVLTGGFIPSVALSGLMTGIIIRKFTVDRSARTVLAILSFGIASLGAGIAGLNLFFIEGLYGNPAWALIASGTAAILFSAIFYLDDVINILTPVSFLRSIGENMMMLYLIPFFLLNISGLAGINILFFHKYHNPAVSISASIAWIFLVVVFFYLLKRLKIRLKF